MGQIGVPLPGTTTPTLQNSPNITPTAIISQAAIPAHLVSHEKNVVAISGPKLAEVLDVYYKAGIRHVEVAVIAGGQLLLADCTITARHNKQRGRTYFWLYPLQPAQTLFRDLYRKYRGEAPRRVRKPMPVLILTVKPK